MLQLLYKLVTTESRNEEFFARLGVNSWPLSVKGCAKQQQAGAKCSAVCKALLGYIAKAYLYSCILVAAISLL